MFKCPKCKTDVLMKNPEYLEVGSSKVKFKRHEGWYWRCPNKECNTAWFATRKQKPIDLD